MQNITIRTSYGVVQVSIKHEQSTRTIEISLNDMLQDVHTTTIEAPSSVHPSSQKIWHFYERAHQGNYVIRTGLGLCGCYSAYDEFQGIDLQLPESVTAHANSCVTLAHGLQAFYPHLLTPDEYARLTTLLKYHDLGENNYQDQPDDGSQNTREKNQAELLEFTLAVIDFPERIRYTAIKDFVNFQDAQYNYSCDIKRFKIVQLAKVIDKIEAILSGLCYEKNGFVGDLAYKDQHFSRLTEQDRYFIREIGGDSTLVSSWFAHTLHDYHEFYGFSYVMDILRAGVIETRGAWFPWFDDFCERHHIPPSHIHHPRPWDE